MMVMLVTGQRVFGAIGFVGAAAGLLLWGTGGVDVRFAAAMKLMKWYPLLTLPMFILWVMCFRKAGSRTIYTRCSMSGWGRYGAVWRLARLA